MSTHQIDILLSRIESLELCVATLCMAQRGRDTFATDRWFKTNDAGARDWTKGEIMTPQEMVNTKALSFGSSYKQMAARAVAARAARAAYIKQEEDRQRELMKTPEERLREQKERQEEEMYQQELMKERVAARVRAESKILEDEAMKELLKGQLLEVE